VVDGYQALRRIDEFQAVERACRLQRPACLACFANRLGSSEELVLLPSAGALRRLGAAADLEGDVGDVRDIERQAAVMRPVRRVAHLWAVVWRDSTLTRGFAPKAAAIGVHGLAVRVCAGDLAGPGDVNLGTVPPMAGRSPWLFDRSR